jgi:hypothetical protein
MDRRKGVKVVQIDSSMFKSKVCVQAVRRRYQNRRIVSEIKRRKKSPGNGRGVWAKVVSVITSGFLGFSISEITSKPAVNARNDFNFFESAEGNEFVELVGCVMKEVVCRGFGVSVSRSVELFFVSASCPCHETCEAQPILSKVWTD